MTLSSFRLFHFARYEGKKRIGSLNINRKTRLFRRICFGFSAFSRLFQSCELRISSLGLTIDSEREKCIWLWAFHFLSHELNSTGNYRKQRCCCSYTHNFSEFSQCHSWIIFSYNNLRRVRISVFYVTHTLRRLPETAKIRRLAENGRLVSLISTYLHNFIVKFYSKFLLNFKNVHVLERFVSQ